MEKKKNFIINVIFYAMIGTAAFGVCKFVLPALVPFLIAFLLAALLQMPAKKLGKESEQRRRIAAILLCGAFYAVLFFIVIILGTKAVKGIGGMVVATFFMAADFPKITAFFQRRIPAGKEAAVKKGVDYVKNVIFIYIKSYFLLFSLTFVELSIGLLILRIPYAILLSLVIAVFDILPVLGTGGILLPWAVILLVMGNVPLAIGIVVLYIIITAIRNTIEPKIVGKQIGLHPLATLIAMFIGLKLFGIAGMIVFPVALAVLVNMENNGILHRK